MLWVKAFHIVFIASWFAGLFYLPRIYVNLAMVPAGSSAERERLLQQDREQTERQLQQLLRPGPEHPRLEQVEQGAAVGRHQLAGTGESSSTARRCAVKSPAAARRPPISRRR